MSGVEPLRGALWIRPGVARPHALRSTRPDWTARVTRGRLASTLPAALSSLFSLCGHAHDLCARMAVDAALERGEPAVPAVHARLIQQTLREHLLRIWLDWPRQLAAPSQREAVAAAAMALLSRAAVFGERADALDIAAWVQAQVFGAPLQAWVQAWADDPGQCLLAWSQGTTGLLPTLLRVCRPFADTASPAVPALCVNAHPQTLRALGLQLHAAGAALAQQPQWQGDCAETGTWTRRHPTTAAPLDTPWLRLGARLAEVARLALAAGAARQEPPPLDVGALNLGPGHAVAWVEMSRGLLVHQVQLEGRDAAARVVSCHVVAPTEWNFHPDGAVARALERLPDEGGRPPSADTLRRVAVLMAAYDPCVPVKWEPDVSQVREAADA